MLGNCEACCGSCDKMAKQCRLSSPALGQLTCLPLSVTCRTTVDYAEHRSKLKRGHGKLPTKCPLFKSSSSSSSSTCTTSSGSNTIQKLSYLWYLFTLLLLAQSIGFTECASWVKRPQNVSPVLGQEVILQCEVSTAPSETVTIMWQIGVTVLFSGGIRDTTTPARMTLQSGTNNLNISAVTLQDSVTFVCKPFGVSLDSASATVTVLVQPGVPVISLDSGSLTEGTDVVLTCRSSGGNPNPSVAWKRNGVAVSVDSYTVTGATAAGGETRSDLTRRLTWDDHRAVYSCEVENVVNENNPRTVSETLDVRYAPRISFQRDDNQPDRFITLEGVDTTVRCETDANPSVGSSSYAWQKDGVSRGERNDQLRFSNAAKTDQGLYTCFATNSVGDRNASIMLDVQYTPVITNIPARKVVNESDYVNVTAVVDANPDTFSNSWDRDGSNPTLGRSIIFNSVRREDAKNYTFQAVNRLRATGQEAVSSTAAKTMELIVQYPPGIATFPPLSSHNVGDRVEITCNLPVPGIPAPTYEWRKVGQTSIIGTGQIYTIPTATLPDNGQYQCRGRNMLGPGPWQTTTLAVNEDARFTTNLPPAMNVTINREGFNLSCSARARPQPYIQWKKNGNPFPNPGDGDFYTIREEEKDTDDGYSFLLTSFLEFKGFKRKTGLTNREDQLVMDDSANYTCEIELDRSQTIHLHVMYPPVVTVDPRKVAQVMSSAVEFRCSARANPEPLFRWLFKEKELVSVDRHRIRSGMQGVMPGEYLSTLTIYNLTDDDLGDYRCRSYNDLGSNAPDVGVASVVQKSAPDAPTHLTILQSTWNSVQLQWVPGFNGGEEQTFVVRYISERGEGSKNVQALQYIQNITGLQPDTLYTFSVVGNNSFGLGAVSETVQNTTKYYNVTTPRDVKFNRFTNELLFNAPTGAYTARIEVKLTNSDDWIVSEENASTRGGSIKLKESSVKDVRISFCLESQTYICSEPVTAEHTGEEPEKSDMPIEWVIAIACVCAIVIILLIIALVFVIRRRRQKADKDYELETQANRRSQPINGARPANGDVRNNSPKRGYDNPDYSSPQMNGGPGHKEHNHHSPRPNGHIPRNDSFGSQDSMQKYTDENDINGRHIQSYGDQPLEFIPYSSHHFNNYQDLPPPYNRASRPAKDPYMDYQHKDSSMSGQESGYSTPEPAKPKKVIYEVIV